MQAFNEVLTVKIQEILNLQTEIELTEKQYRLLLASDQPFELLRETRLKIKNLKLELKAKEESAITSF